VPLVVGSVVAVVGASTAVAAARLPELPVYASYDAATDDELWSHDPHEGAAAGYAPVLDPAGQPVVEFSLWATPPADGFVPLYRLVRPNGQHVLTTDATGGGIGAVEGPLGHVGTSAEVVAAALGDEGEQQRQCPTPVHRFHHEGYYSLDHADERFVPVDRYVHHVGGPGASPATAKDGCPWSGTTASSVGSPPARGARPSTTGDGTVGAAETGGAHRPERSAAEAVSADPDPDPVDHRVRLDGGHRDVARAVLDPPCGVVPGRALRRRGRDAGRRGCGRSSYASPGQRWPGNGSGTGVRGRRRPGAVGRDGGDRPGRRRRDRQGHLHRPAQVGAGSSGVGNCTASRSGGSMRTSSALDSARCR
jgi:hypothetical protein